MTVRLDLSSDGLREVADRAAQALRERGVVGFDLTEVRGVTALATDEAAAKRLCHLNTGQSAGLMFYDAQAAGDLLLRRSSHLERLLRGMQGPLLVAVSAQDIDDSLLDELPDATRRAVLNGDWLRLVPPPGEVSRKVQHQLSGPLLLFTEVDMRPDEYDMLVTAPAAAVRSPTEIRVTSTGWELVTRGDLTHSDLLRIMAQRIVFVCTGNTCRSPMAEAMFRAMLAEHLGCAPSELVERGFEVASAGIAAMQGAPASPESVQICASQGVDLSSHSSQPLTEELLERADRLYTMTGGHRDAILERYPSLQQRVQLLSREGEDVSDPIGMGRDAYERSFAEITDNLRLLIEELTQSNA